MKNILKRIAVVVVLFATVANMWVANTNKEVNLNTSLESLEADAQWAQAVENILYGLAANILYNKAKGSSSSSSSSCTNLRWVTISYTYIDRVFDRGRYLKRYSVVNECQIVMGENNDCIPGTTNSYIVYVQEG